MQDWIATTSSKEDAIQFFQYTLSDTDRQTIVQAGRDILQHVPQIPYACAHMSALWGSRIRDTTLIPTYVVAGNLFIHTKNFFG